MGALAITVLYGVTKYLSTLHPSDQSDWEYAQYNASLVYCLPKKATGQTEDGVDSYTADSFRPLRSSSG